mmetsp:Transcript_31939/g.94044  ORF Transcript_31939/g.94044 Transcript_31939/m.94044 type:complete len:214 (-) Transcript_31939:1005-1646(-)
MSSTTSSIQNASGPLSSERLVGALTTSGANHSRCEICSANTYSTVEFTIRYATSVALILCWKTGLGPTRDGSAGSRGASAHTKPSTKPSSAMRTARYPATHSGRLSAQGLSRLPKVAPERSIRPYATAAVRAEAGFSTSVSSASLIDIRDTRSRPTPSLGGAERGGDRGAGKEGERRYSEKKISSNARTWRALALTQGKEHAALQMLQAPAPV